MNGTTFVYIDYGPSVWIGRELRYSLATLLAEMPDARVRVYTDKPAVYQALHPNVTPRPLGDDLAAWMLGGAYNHRVKPCALADALDAHGGLCVLLDTDSYIAPGFAEALEQATRDGPAMDCFERRDPYPELAGWSSQAPPYAYGGEQTAMHNSGLVAARDAAALRFAIALIDALWRDGKRQFNIEQIAISEAFRLRGARIGELRPSFQHYCRRSLKRYMHWRIEAWIKRAPAFAPTRPCIAHPRDAVRVFNWVNHVGRWYR